MDHHAALYQIELTTAALRGIGDELEAWAKEQQGDRTAYHRLSSRLYQHAGGLSAAYDSLAQLHRQAEPTCQEERDYRE